jgi:DNA-binding beta-propeller fold protein YncE
MNLGISRTPLVVKLALLGIFLCTSLGTRSIASASDGNYHVLQQWPLSGDGGWNYLLTDSASNRLYVPRDNRVTVLDTRTGSTVGEIAGLTDVRSIALDTNGKLGYISDGISGSVHVFDRSTLRLTSSIVVGGIPDAIVFEPTTRNLFVFNSHNKSAAVVETTSNRVVATLPLPGRPSSAVVDGHGQVFVNLVSTGQLARIDGRSLTLKAVWPLASCTGPSGLAIDTVHSRLFSTCENKTMAISDGTAGKIVDKVPVGEGAKSVAFDSDLNLVFSSNGDGSLSVIRENTPDSFSVIQTLPTQPGTRTMVLDSAANRLYLVTARFGQRTEPTSEELQFRPTPVRDSVAILVIGR